jgi:2-oxoglutarate dehydrogenase E1 component
MADDSGRLNDILSETSFLYGANAGFVEALQAKWAADPVSVEPSWAAFFATLADAPDAVRQSSSPPAWTPSAPVQARPDWLNAIDGLWPAVEAKLGKQIAEKSPAATQEEIRARTLDSLRAIMMIRAYRMRGHLKANLDPLGIAITAGDAS